MEDKEKEFSPREADEMYDDILKGVEFHKLARAMEIVGTVIHWTMWLGLLLVLLTACYIVFLKYGFGVAFMFFILPVILNKYKFKTLKFVWRSLSYFLFVLDVAYALFLSFTSQPKIYILLYSVLAVGLLLLIFYAILIAMIIKQDSLTSKQH